MSEYRAVTIIVPVYGDLPSFKECLTSLQTHVDTDRHQVMLVNDCGPEAEEMETYIRQTVAGQNGFTYHRNPENLGFVGTCNRAVFELEDTDNDIMLLNSDTIATSGFLEEMVEVLYSEEDIAAVSPRSNNATLATIPVAAASRHGIDHDKSYEAFQAIKNKMSRYHTTPVVHGVCMLIRRTVIHQHGLFDSVFGQGYGEEVDFCMRLKQLGYKCVLSNRSFVFHHEARSFTLQTKHRLLSANHGIIEKRYPYYNQMISDYLESAHTRENELLRAVGIGPAWFEKNPIKKLLKRNRLVYRFARYFNKHIRRKSD